MTYLYAAAILAAMLLIGALAVLLISGIAIGGWVDFERGVGGVDVYFFSHFLLFKLKAALLDGMYYFQKNRGDIKAVAYTRRKKKKSGTASAAGLLSLKNIPIKTLRINICLPRIDDAGDAAAAGIVNAAAAGVSAFLGQRINSDDMKIVTANPDDGEMPKINFKICVNYKILAILPQVLRILTTRKREIGK